MMKRTAVTAMLLILMVMGAGTGQAGSVDKARDFMKAGMYKQAEAVLEQEINENPANAEAHFLLGKCYLSLDEFRSFPKAEKRFSSAVKLDSSEYAHKIVDVYIDAGMQQLERVDKGKALEFLDEARKYNSQGGDEIARKCFNKGEELLRYGEYGKADGYFFVAAKYDSSLKGDIARIYYRQYQAEEKLPLLKQASRYDGGEYGKEYARASLEGLMDVSADRWGKRAKEAQKYLSDQEILELSVDYYIRKWGEPTAVVKLNEDRKWKRALPKVRVWKDQVRYISLHDFKMKTNKGEGEWDAQLTEKTGMVFAHHDMKGDASPIHFCKKNTPTAVYVWLAEYSK